jgi:hypothetical protein
MYFPRFVRFCIFKSNTSNNCNRLSLSRPSPGGCFRPAVSHAATHAAAPRNNGWCPAMPMSSYSSTRWITTLGVTPTLTSSMTASPCRSFVARPVIANQVVSAVYERPVQMATWMAFKTGWRHFLLRDEMCSFFERLVFSSRPCSTAMRTSPRCSSPQVLIPAAPMSG